VKRKQIEVPAEVAVDKSEGWKESKKRKGEGGKPVTKRRGRFCEFECVQGKLQVFVEGERVGCRGASDAQKFLVELARGSDDPVGSTWETPRVNQITEVSTVGGGGGTDGEERQEEGDAEEKEEEEEEEVEEKGEREGDAKGDVEAQEGEEEGDYLTTMSEEEESNVFRDFFGA
jgi:hypothetical protein